MTWFCDKIAPPASQNGSGFPRYSRNEFDNLRRQHNILVFVGNGFDLQVLKNYNCSVDTRYETFFHYLQMLHFDQDNLIMKHMEAERDLHVQEGGHDNWSDIEAALARTLSSSPHEAEKLRNDLRAIQAAFAQFLDMTISSQLLHRLGADSAGHELSSKSLAEFLRDVGAAQFSSMYFPNSVDHYSLLNFKFINFNYTTLLDNYVYLDQDQFDPLENRTVDTNFRFNTNPFQRADSSWDPYYSCYVLADVVHPHGILTTPRSLLFGIDAEDDFKRRRNDTQRFMKVYWSQAHALYRPYFSQTDLFIIFGSSLGMSDGWWWRNIVRALREVKEPECQELNNPQSEQAELIIYWYQGDKEITVSDVKALFLEAAGVHNDASDRERLEKQIYVVLFNSQSERAFLRTSVGVGG